MEEPLAQVPPDKRVRPPSWAPEAVYRKLARVVELTNAQLPPRVFLQLTGEDDDDVPVVRALVGPRDPYTAERFGSFAFYSTQRGMEWYLKNVGPTAFVPNQGMVFVTWFEDHTRDESPILLLYLDQDDEKWANALRSLFDV